MRRRIALLCARGTPSCVPTSHSQQFCLHMNRLSLCIAAAMLATGALAQTSAPPQPTPQPQTPPQKPRPGMIIERPNPGRITEPEKPATPAPTTPAAGNLAGQKIERLEATGNTSVASDTIRDSLGVNPGDPYDPALLQKNFLNLWQPDLFDDTNIETDRGAIGVIVRAVVKARP